MIFNGRQPAAGLIWWGAVKRAFFYAVPLAIVAAAIGWLFASRAPLSAIEMGGTGPPTVVLLHGYGSRADDWLQFEPHWRLPNNARRIYPQAPLRGPITGARGWWWLNIEGNIPAGERFPDYSSKNPGGIKLASRLVRTLIKGEQQPLVLGGFSQGAMVSGEIAFQTDQPLAGLVLLGGTTVNEEAWAEHFAGRRLLPIFIAHGRHDGVLSFEKMERFQARLKAFGMNVTWLPFDGDHDIPEDVFRAMNEFVSRVVGLQSPAGRN
jgi:phospholipase/carboxylesterase